MAKDPRSYLQRAEEHRRQGRLKEAIALCIEALAQHPGLDAARITLGRSYLEAGQAEPARDTLSGVFGRLPEHHLAGKTLAEAQRLLGDLSGAEATCRTLLDHYPRDREIEPLLAAILAARPAAVEAGDGAEVPPDLAPEYLPEDVATGAPGTSAAAPARGPERPAPPAAPPSPPVPAAVAPVAAPPPAAAAAPVGPPPSARLDGDALETNTLAELYLRQGMAERAIAVYRGMLRVEPGNAAVRRRLAELEKGVAAPSSPPPAPAAASMPAPAPVVRPSAAASTAPRAIDRAAIVRLERWLETIRAGGADSRGGAAP